MFDCGLSPIKVHCARLYAVDNRYNLGSVSSVDNETKKYWQLNVSFYSTFMNRLLKPTF